MRRTTRLLLALVIVACACGDDDDGTQDAASAPEVTATAVADPLATGEPSVVPAPIVTSVPDPTATPPRGVVADDPGVWMVEIDDLADSAAPGRLVGFVRLLEAASSGAPSSDAQPVCVGAGDYESIAPGAVVSALTPDGNQLARTILRGSAYDAHVGCGMWFGLDVAGYTGELQLDVAGHRLQNPVDQAALDASGWIVDLWTTAADVSANCANGGRTCVILERRERG